jgi:transcriptional regulator with XRE-family HTH domain
MKLKKQIKASGVKQIWIANYLGITEAYLSLIINGKRKPSDELLKRLTHIIAQKAA